MEHARQLRGHRTRRGRGVELRVIEGRKQIVADRLHAAYLRLGEAIRALREVTVWHGSGDDNHAAFVRSGEAVAAAGDLLEELAEDFPGALPALPGRGQLAGRASVLPALEKAGALDGIFGLLEARDQLAPLLREAGREAGRTVPDDLSDGSSVERAFAAAPARLALGVIVRGRLTRTP